MQIRRSENLLFPNVNTNVASNNKLFTMIKGKQEDTPVTVSISKSGRARARMLKDSPKKDVYMKNAESKIDKILDTIREGGTLSKEEEELINNELKNMSEQKYKDYRDLRLKPEDVMTELKENYLRRERLFFEMQKQLEEDNSSQGNDVDTVKIMTYMQEKENDEKITEMIEEYGEGEGEEALEDNSKTKELEGEETEQQEFNVNVEGEQVDGIDPIEDSLQKRAMKMIEGVENQMNEVKDANDKARKKENSFAKGLEDDYKRIQQVLNNEEVTIEDKVMAYDRFVDEASVNARGREVQRIKKQFDAETLMLARIKFHGHNRIDNVINRNLNRSQIGTDFIKSILT